jgi:large subunit ribosomal protein L35
VFGARPVTDFAFIWSPTARKLQHSGSIESLAMGWSEDPCDILVLSRNIVMPKLKTHKGASKRFQKTGTGKIVRQHAFARHILTSKGRKRKNKLHQSVVADDSDQAKLARMIPY